MGKVLSNHTLWAGTVVKQSWAILWWEIAWDVLGDIASRFRLLLASQMTGERVEEEEELKRITSSLVVCHRGPFD